MSCITFDFSFSPVHGPFLFIHLPVRVKYCYNFISYFFSLHSTYTLNYKVVCGCALIMLPLIYRAPHPTESFLTLFVIMGVVKSDHLIRCLGLVPKNIQRACKDLKLTLDVRDKHWIEESFGFFPYYIDPKSHVFKRTLSNKCNQLLSAKQVRANFYNKHKKKTA